MAERLPPESGAVGSLPAFFQGQDGFLESSLEDEALEPESGRVWEDANHSSPDAKPVSPRAYPPTVPLASSSTSLSSSSSPSSSCGNVNIYGSISPGGERAPACSSSTSTSPPTMSISKLSRSLSAGCTLSSSRNASSSSLSKAGEPSKSPGGSPPLVPSSSPSSAFASSSLNPSSAPFFSSASSLDGPFIFSSYSSPASSPTNRSPVSPLAFASVPVDSAFSSFSSSASSLASFSTSPLPSLSASLTSPSSTPISSPTATGTSSRSSVSMKPFASFNGLSPRARPFSLGPPPGFSAPAHAQEEAPVSVHLRPPGYQASRLHSDLGTNLHTNQSALSANQTNLQAANLKPTTLNVLQNQLQAIQSQIQQFQTMQHQLPLASQQQLVQLVLQQQEMLLQQQQQQQGGYFPSLTITAPEQTHTPTSASSPNLPPGFQSPISPQKPRPVSPREERGVEQHKRESSFTFVRPEGSEQRVVIDPPQPAKRESSFTFIRPEPSVEPGVGRVVIDPPQQTKMVIDPPHPAKRESSFTFIRPEASSASFPPRHEHGSFPSSSSPRDGPFRSSASPNNKDSYGEKPPASSPKSQDVPMLFPPPTLTGQSPRSRSSYQGENLHLSVHSAEDQARQFQSWKNRDRGLDTSDGFNTFDQRTPDLAPPAPVARSRSTPVFPNPNNSSYTPSDPISADDLSDPNNPVFQSPGVANLLNHVKYVKSLNAAGPVMDEELVRQGLLVQLATLQATQTRQQMQAVLQQPEAADSVIGAATMAAHAAATNLAAQQLQYLQTAALRGQIDPSIIPQTTGVGVDFAPLAAPFPSTSTSSSPVPSPTSSPRWELDSPVDGGYQNNPEYIGPSPKGHHRNYPSDPPGSGYISGGSLDTSQRGDRSDRAGRRERERHQGGDRSFTSSRGREGSPSPSPSPSNSQLPWLEAFRAAKGMDQLSLKEVVVRGWLKDLATDQCGSRFLQRRLEAASPEHKQLAFEQLIQTGILPLCTDVFGNYVIQKFFEYGGPEHRTTLASKLLGHVLRLSLQMYGCRVVQKAIELAEPPIQMQLVKELEGHVMECVKDQNGNHVIQKCLEKVPANKIDFILDAFKGQISHLATHPYGCRVIQRYIQTCVSTEPEGDARDPLNIMEQHWTPRQEDTLVNELLGDHTDELCRNQYGNYVIQHLLVHGSPWQRSGITHALLGKLLVLSKHKFASNVVEKCFVYGSHQDRTLLIQEVLGRHADGSCPLLVMVRDQYANYVVQKMIDVCDQDQLAMIVQRIKRHVPGLRKIPYGKNILTRLEKLTGTVFSGTNQHGSDAFPNAEVLSSSPPVPFPGTADFNPVAPTALNMNPWPPILGNSPSISRRGFLGPDSPTHEQENAGSSSTSGNGNNWGGSMRSSWSSMEGRPERS